MSVELEEIFTGRSSAVVKLRTEIQRLTRKKSNVLITGPRGSGKTLAAQLLHELSGKGDYLILSAAVSTDRDLAALSEQERKTSSTTVLFDNIEEFSQLDQGRIVRFIGEARRMAGLRVIVTNAPKSNDDSRLLRDLAKAIAGFDELRIPALMERRDDIPYLVETFTRQAAESLGLKVQALDINTLDMLCRMPWKGNVQELKNVVEQAVVSSRNGALSIPRSLFDEQTQVGDIIANIDELRTFAFDDSLADLERTLIERALQTAGFNQSRAALALNLSEANLRYRLKKFGIKG